MDTTEKKKSRDFNIYYLNFSKVYEIAMIINNVIPVSYTHLDVYKRQVKIHAGGHGKERYPCLAEY